MPIITPFTAYLILTNPYNDLHAQDITLVSGFEFRIVRPAVPEFFTLSTVFNGFAINVGTDPDFVVGFNEPVIVPENGAALLITFLFMVTQENPMYIYLDQTDLPIVPGAMAIIDGSQSYPDPEAVQAVYPVSGDFANPVFGINADVVANETKSWGSVKSLYR